MSASETTQFETGQQGLRVEIEALLAVLLGDTQPAEITAAVGRLEAAVNQDGDAPAPVITEVRRAIGLVRNGQPCAGVSALLAARSEFDTPSS